VNQEIKNFENADYLVELTEGEKCRLYSKVHVKPKAAQNAYQKAIKKVNKQISIPGFRKGRAPDRTVISRYGSYVEQEWKEILISDAYRAAVELSNIYPISKESIQKPQLESCSQEGGAIIHISYERLPNVPAIDFSQIQISPIERTNVDQEKIDEIIEEVKKAHANWESIEGRPVQLGDFVDLTIDSLDEDPPQNIVKDRRFEVTEKKLPAWLRNAVIGRTPGEVFEGESELDEQAEESTRKNFKPTKVRIALNAIQKILLPELTDELAKKAGAESIEDLKNKVLRNLEKEADEELKKNRLKALEEKLLEKYTFDVPASLVKNKVEDLREKAATQEENTNEEELEQSAIRELRLYFINKQIAKQGSISITNQELNDEIMRFISQNPYLYSGDQNEEKTRELVSRMAAILMQRKTEEYALSQI
jgi:trigger factor